MALSKCCIPRPYQISAYSRHKAPGLILKNSKKLIKFVHLQNTNDELGKITSTEDGKTTSTEDGLRYIMASSMSGQGQPNPVL